MALFLSIVTLSQCGRLLVRDDCACGYYTDAAGSKLFHWDDGSQIRFETDRNFPENMRSSLLGIEAAYNDTLARSSIRINAMSSDAPSMNYEDPDSVKGDGVNGIYWIEGEWPWLASNPTSDAITVVVFSKSKIVEADIFFRADSYKNNGEHRSQVPSYGTFQTASASSQEQWVFVIGLHEMGHALGLVHSDEENSLMYPSVGLNFLSQPFSQRDLETLERVYAVEEDTFLLSHTALVSDTIPSPLSNDISHQSAATKQENTRQHSCAH